MASKKEKIRVLQEADPKSQLLFFCILRLFNRSSILFFSVWVSNQSHCTFRDVLHRPIKDGAY